MVLYGMSVVKNEDLVDFKWYMYFNGLKMVLDGISVIQKCMYILSNSLRYKAI